MLAFPLHGASGIRTSSSGYGGCFPGAPIEAIMQRIVPLYPLAALLLCAGGASATQSPQTPLPGSAIPQFVEPLPLLSVQPGGTLPTIFGNTDVTLSMCETKANV